MHRSQRIDYKNGGKKTEDHHIGDCRSFLQNILGRHTKGRGGNSTMAIFPGNTDGKRCFMVSQYNKSRNLYLVWLNTVKFTEKLSSYAKTLEATFENDW